MSRAARRLANSGSGFASAVEGPRLLMSVACVACLAGCDAIGQSPFEASQSAATQGNLPESPGGGDDPVAAGMGEGVLAPGDRAPFVLTEVAAEAGVDFTFHNGSEAKVFSIVE